MAQLRKGVHPKSNLDLRLTNQGLIRCEGRLQNASLPWDTIHPILLPRNSPVVRAYVRQIHLRNHHIGVSHTMVKIRERFWLIKMRATVKSVLSHCVTCKWWYGGSFKLPPMPPLPLIRTAEVSPFLHVGTDLMGPVRIHGSGDEPLKVWIVLFTCLVTRAVHLEVALDQSAEEFLMSLSRFTSRRGVPRVMISDNGTNFVFVQPLVGCKVKVLDEKLNLFLTSNSILWHFIPTYAPWYGGAYERLVAVVKRCFRKSYGSRLLTYVQLTTALAEVENVVNRDVTSLRHQLN